MRLLRKAIERYDVRLWSYALMPNHVQFVVVPNAGSIRLGLYTVAHGKYARVVQCALALQSGHLWQADIDHPRMDDNHLVNGIPYVESQSRASRVGHVSAEDYPWSSAAARLRFETRHLRSFLTISRWSHKYRIGRPALAGIESEEETPQNTRMH
jgi:hypothetical protein